MRTLYDTLGVSADADSTTIRRAYHDRARELHPDHHQGAPPDVLAHIEAEMAAVNDAYAVLGEEARRHAYDEQVANSARGPSSPAGTAPPTATAAPVGRAPRADECRLCGYTPAADVTFRSETGMLVRRTRRWMDGPFCASCGLAVFRQMMNRTLITGWWGVISFLVNFGSIFENLKGYSQIRRLGPPRHRDPAVRSVVPQPLDPGKDLFHRVGVYVAAALLVFGIATAVHSNHANTTASGSTYYPPITAPSFAPNTASDFTADTIPPSADTIPPSEVAPSSFVGQCVTFTLDRTHIQGEASCLGPHDAIVHGHVKILAGGQEKSSR